MKAIILVVLAVVLAMAEAANYAVLVAGSNGYYNYRHQSDVCDMYQILHMNGIPDSNIVVMMYDDIANNAQNPKKGQVFNWPGGPDVYKGTPKDYTGVTVTATNFLNILQGKDMTGIGSGKTLHSGVNDYIFAFYSDHGSTGLVAFPTGGYLYATDLNNALKSMSQLQKFKQFTFYLEACESGSMFNNLLPADIKIYAMTASDPTESSWACDYDSSVAAYLDDCFSVNFMLDTRKHDTGSYTLNQQFTAVKAQTTQSHVCQYGDLTFQTEEISVFMGKTATKMVSPRVKHNRKDAVNSRMAVLSAMERRIDAAPAENRAALQAQYENEILKLKRADRIFAELRSRFAAKEFRPTNDLCTQASELNHECVKASAEAIRAQCGEMDDYMLENFKHVAKFCNAGLDVANFRSVLKELC